MTARFRQRVVRTRFEAIASTYDGTIVRRRETYNAGVDEVIAARVRPLAGQSSGSPLRILDAACGTGSRWVKLASVLPQAKAAGLDLSLGMCAQARQLGTFAGVVRAPLTRLPFTDDVFDVVTCLFFSFCYLTSHRERLQALAEMRRVLRPGGLLLIDVINMWHRGEGMEYRRSWPSLALDALRSVADPRLSIGDKLYQTPHESGPLDGYFHGFSERSFIRLLNSAGLRQHELLSIGYNSGQFVRRRYNGQFLACIEITDGRQGAG